MLVYLVTLALYLCASCYGQDILTRSDPAENVSILWDVTAVRVGQYYYISIHRNKQVIFFCLDPFIKPCQVNPRGLQLISSPRITDGDTIVNKLGFSISDVTSLDAAHYRMEVVASSLDNPEYRDAVLYVYHPPTTPVIEGISWLKEGDSVTLTCRSSLQSNPEQYRKTSGIQYRWYTKKSNDSLPRIIHEGRLPSDHVINNGVLMISGLTRNSSGTRYFCTAQEWNAALVSDNSDDVTLDVMFISTLSMIILNNKDQGQDDIDEGHIYVNQGDILELACRCQCNPGCSYTWSKDNNHVIGSLPTLTLVATTRGVAMYMCKATNILATLSVSVQVHIELNPETIPTTTIQDTTTESWFLYTDYTVITNTDDTVTTNTDDTVTTNTDDTGTTNTDHTVTTNTDDTATTNTDDTVTTNTDDTVTTNTDDTVTTNTADTATTNTDDTASTNRVNNFTWEVENTEDIKWTAAASSALTTTPDLSGNITSRNRSVVISGNKLYGIYPIVIGVSIPIGLFICGLIIYTSIWIVRKVRKKLDEASQTNANEELHGDVHVMTNGRTNTMSNGRTDSVSNGKTNHLSNGKTSHMLNGKTSHMSNGKTSHMSNGKTSHMSNGRAKTDQNYHGIRSDLASVYTISLPTIILASAYNEDGNTSLSDATLGVLEIESRDTDFDSISKHTAEDDISISGITCPLHDDIYGSYGRNSVEYSTYSSCLTNISSMTMTKTYYDEATCVVDERNCSYL